MKKAIIISFAAGFGITTSILLFSFAMLAFGFIKHSFIGGYQWDFGDSAKASADYEMERKTSRGLQFKLIDCIRGKDGLVQAIIEINNPSDGKCDDVIKLSFVFYQSDKVVGIVEQVEMFEIDSKSTVKTTLEIKKDVPESFDKVEIINKA